jgi:DNA polymerase-3 subunit beta
MIEKTAYAICHDETKYNLNGVYVHGTTALKMVATDGHRLAIMELPVNTPLPQILSKGVILPRKGIFELKKLMEEEKEDILLGFMDNNAVVRKGDSTIVMRLVDGEFPDYTRVIPIGNDKDIRFRREPMLHSLRRMAILSSEKYKGVKLETREGILEISSSNPELGEASEEVEVSMGDVSFSVRFNARYLIDVLSFCNEEEMILKLKDELSPALLTPVGKEGFMAVVMPMRL